MSNYVDPVRPNPSPKAVTTARGFTLIETMVTLVVASILATAAGPSFSDFITGQRIKTVAFDLFSDLVYARSTAIKTNSEVVVARVGNSWTNGWTITWVDKSGTNRTLRSHPNSAGALILTGSIAQFGFQRNGRPLVGSSTVKFTLDTVGGKPGSLARCIQVDPSGRPTSLTGVCA